MIDGGIGRDTVDFREETAAVVLRLTGAVDARATVGGVAADLVRNVEQIYGGSAGDKLTGDGGANALFGFGGADALAGGGGADKLTGGLGGDRFTFYAVGDSTAAARDVVLDFSRAERDLIDLRGIDADLSTTGDQAFVFGDLGEAGRLKVTAAGAGQWLVEADVDGGGADFSVLVRSATELGAADFYL